MKRKIMNCFLAGLCVLLSVLGFIPMRGYAVVPLSLVESALASYTVSAGYKWYSDGSASEMSQSITNLYNTWYDAVGKNIDGVLTLAQFAAGYGLPSGSRDYVYLDNSGQIVISKLAADVFQQFSDWIETEYSVTIGSETPTAIYSGGQTVFSDGNGTNCWKLVPLVRTAVASGVYSRLYTSQPVGTYNGQDLYFGTTNANGVYYITQNAAGTKISIKNGGSGTGTATFFTKNTNNNYYTNRFQFGNGYGDGSTWYTTTETRVTWNVPISDASELSTAFGSFSESGVVGLGVSLAQAVTDVVGQASDDDVVVIGVGAGVGATAQDIASLVADGIKAGTLEPSVSITSEAVIDTPVQPYPDIDGLGLPSLGAELVSRFPFCIPWDFVDVVRLFAAEPVAPRFQFDIVPDRVKAFCNISQSTTIDLNMGDSKFEKIGVFCRWGSLIGFCWGLVLLTKRMIWTA